MSVFKKGQNKVNRRVVLEGLTAAAVVRLPAYAVVQRFYARNRSTTASSLSAGNVAAGAQYLAATAIGVADGSGPAVLRPTAALQTQAISKVDSDLHITLSAYPLVTDSTKGAVDVVIEYEELEGSLAVPGGIHIAY